MGTTDEAGMVSAVSNHKKNKEKQRIRFVIMSTEKMVKKNAKRKKTYHHTTTQGLSVIYNLII